MNILQQARQLLRDGGLNKLASREESPQTSWERIGWWEARRVPYNLILGCVGLITCLFGAIAALAAEILYGKDFGLPDPPIFGILIIVFYAIGANVCFTGGWICELVIGKLWPREADKFASRTFAAGLIFSVLLTLIPCALIVVTGILSLAKHYHSIR